ncbi:MAG: hypothetical protein Q7R48_02795 [bacterium]|nr:hypothetical protein [bacterium]
MSIQKYKAFLIPAAFLLVVVVIAGGAFYSARQQKNPVVSQPVPESSSDSQTEASPQGVEVNPKEIEAKNTYRDQRLNYSLVLPDGWIAKEVKAYPSLSMDALIQKFNPEWRALEVARVYVSSNASLSDCVKLARGLDNCGDIQTGAYVSVTVDYRGEATIDEVVARDKQEIGADLMPADISIANAKTFVWNNAPVCKNCVFSKTYVFNGKPHFTYEVTTELYKNPKEPLSAEVQAQYIQDLKTIVSSLELR